jgi:CubicO group peptidase (beta-lactamase class C family)
MPASPSLPVADPYELGLAPAQLTRLSDAFRAEIELGRLPGAVMLVGRRGRIGWFEALGMADPVRGIPMAHDALFRIYSMTKPIVSLAVMMLVEEGRLLLDDPVSRHLPEYAAQKVAVQRDGGMELVPVARDATVQDLLRHTSGLAYEFTGDSPVQRRYAELRVGSLSKTNAEFSEQLASLPLMHQPGARWESPHRRLGAWWRSSRARPWASSWPSGSLSRSAWWTPVSTSRRKSSIALPTPSPSTRTAARRSAW